MVAQIETLQITSFLAVAETGSFRKASTRLGVGQPAVSRRVQGLEDLLGVSLFERRPCGARLTSAGAYFASQARVLLDDLNAAVDSAKSAGVAGNGHLQIGLMASLSRGSLRAVFERFTMAHADVDVCFVEASRNELLTLLNHRRIDVSYASGDPETAVGDGFTLAKEDIFLAVQAGGHLARRERLAWQDIVDATFVVSAREPGPEIQDYIVRRVTGLGRTATVRRHRLDRESIMSIVGLGLGVSLVADYWRGVRYPNVAFIPIGNGDERIPFYLTWRQANDNNSQRRFISLARIEAKRNGVVS